MKLTNSDLGKASELRYLLTKLMSECNELSHAVSKVLDFGVEDQVHFRHVGHSGVGKIQAEYNDILGVVKALNKIGFTLNADPIAIDNKVDKIYRYMEDSRVLGVLEKEVLLTIPRYRETRKELKALLTNPLITFKGMVTYDMRGSLSLARGFAETVKFLAIRPGHIGLVKNFISTIVSHFPSMEIKLSIEVCPESGFTTFEIDCFTDQGCDTIWDRWVDVVSYEALPATIGVSVHDKE